MKAPTLALAAAMAAGTLAHAQEAVQWRVEDGGNGHWYALIVTPCGNWDACNALSAVQGGHLASVTSGAEQSFLEAIVLNTPNSFGDYWLGGVQPLDSPEPGGGWAWTDGSPWTYSQWGTSQFGHALPDDWPTSAPNEENYLEINLRAPGTTPFGQWNDEGDYPNGALIEWSADCNGDGIVDYGQILDGTFEDAKGNGVPDCCDEGVDCDPCPGDVNFDGIVNGADISVLLGFWGLNGKPNNADTNNDGQVDGTDLANVLGSWGECP